jgi:hypothetical protein
MTSVINPSVMTNVINPATLIQSSASGAQIVSIARQILVAHPNFLDIILNLHVSINSSNSSDTIADIKGCLSYNPGFLPNLFKLPRACKQGKFLQIVLFNDRGSSNKNDEIFKILNPVASDEVLSFSSTVLFEEHITRAVNCAALLICLVLLSPDSEVFEFKNVIFGSDFNSALNPPTSIDITSPTLSSSNEINSFIEKSISNQLDSRFEIFSSNLDLKLDSLFNAISKNRVEPPSLVTTSPRKQPKVSSSKRGDKGSPYSSLSNLNYDEDDDEDADLKDSSSQINFSDEIEEFSDDDSNSKSNFNSSYSTSERKFIEDQLVLWKSNQTTVSNPREVHTLTSLAMSKGLLTSQASGQLTQLRFLKNSVKSSSSHDYLTLGSDFVDCETSILLPRSYPEFIESLNETICCLQKMICKEIECSDENRSWASSILVFYPRYAAAIQLKYKPVYNQKYCLSQFAITLRLHTWIMNIVVLTKNPSFFAKLGDIWDKHIKHEFESTPTSDKLLNACSLLGYRCISCGRIGFASQVCPAPLCMAAQSPSKVNTPNSKSQLDEEYKLWLLLPETTTFFASKPKTFKPLQHFFTTVASKALKDSHNKSKGQSSNSIKFSSHSKCLAHFVVNQNEIPLMGGYDHYIK